MQELHLKRNICGYASANACPTAVRSRGSWGQPHSSDTADAGWAFGTLAVLEVSVRKCSVLLVLTVGDWPASLSYENARTVLVLGSLGFRRVLNDIRETTRCYRSGGCDSARRISMNGRLEKSAPSPEKTAGVLAVSSSPADRGRLREILSQGNWKLYEASDCSEALATLRDQQVPGLAWTAR